MKAALPMVVRLFVLSDYKTNQMFVIYKHLISFMQALKVSQTLIGTHYNGSSYSENQRHRR
ncbi:hypothetical protein J2Y45_006515 [Dyadobacter sp. BE34]|uniref:Uncharacterized protein n=1 Tax=Dyadobacter fermentans TaxID=94254 RepID=A0ABU1R022_9BACT|nr:hypothetical protein [Dyadobacter fermentans]MDR7042354.1 hypothetical protein [Dyadobacter sp. BE242]MDR7201352.1 hypothetical protein [Dyadobacter sp. BE34]MDR7215899.1 hypothetical protein [Dyadobacter sp. BE31]MDR7263435.1 hypothetical protein [Dyadobacter sp. BE32]